MFYTYACFPSGRQLTAPPPTCLGDIFTFRCNVTGDRNGVTIWRVGGSSECLLAHTSTSSTICGRNGTLVECFGPALSRAAGNMVGNSTLQIIG